MNNISKFFIGTSGWGYDEWKGDFFPSDLPKTQWFEFYVQYFNAVEINATFYRMFKIETYKKWQIEAPPVFRYTLKVPRLITHYKMLMEVIRDINDFCACAQTLGETLGHVSIADIPAHGA